MGILLDTHAFIWYIEGNERLSLAARSEIINAQNDKFISIASLWEIVIKISKNKLELKQSFSEIIQSLLINNIQILEVRTSHLAALFDLPYHHNDPFDRLIIAQAVVEKLTVISLDQHFQEYDIKLIW